MPSRIAAFDVVEFEFLVNVDQHVALGGLPNSRALNLPRLKDHVAIGKDHGPPSPRELLQHFQGGGVQSLGKRIVDQELRDRKQQHVMRMLHAILLQSTR